LADSSAFFFAIARKRAGEGECEIPSAEMSSRMIQLIEKVLRELSEGVKSRCRHSDENYTVVAYVCHDRRTGVEPFLRVDIFKRKKREA
jgi:hypothetical protein